MMPTLHQPDALLRRPIPAGAVLPYISIPAATIETRTSWVVAIVALLTLAFSFGAPWVAVVSLKAIAADFDSGRETPALAGSLGWIGVGVGGIMVAIALIFVFVKK